MSTRTRALQTRDFLRDWSQDPGLALCSLEAKAVAMHLLCLMDFSGPEPRTMATDRELCRVVGGINLPALQRALADLIKHGVLARDPDGCLRWVAFDMTPYRL